MQCNYSKQGPTQYYQRLTGQAYITLKACLLSLGLCFFPCLFYALTKQIFILIDTRNVTFHDLS